MNYLIVIVGPTAIGKTAHSIALAKALQCEILSCDSRQFYKEMCIGTAVPEQNELASAPHHFIQHLSIQDTYNVGLFEKQALAKLDELFATNNTAILVGGSGLYVDAVLNGLDTFPNIEVSIRESIQANYAAQGIEYLQNELKRLDPTYYNTIQTNNQQTLQNPQRLMRFVEVCIGTAKPYSSFLHKSKVIRNFTPILIGLEAPREMLYKRINLRVDQMIAKGLLAEVTALQDEQNNNALQTVGYNELFAYLNGCCSFAEAIDLIKQNTRRYAKRQLTWFKRNESTQWFDYLTPTTTLLDYINTYRK
ncbi:MAG: tRNA (adenosine(37)-N6)-dimethylallyltransferase MiaA [Flavobacterium sp.]|nr:tRNA (adenosine(37)-N6)-dimethylallyltransferase MiaA [Flavobacterium sp.]